MKDFDEYLEKHRWNIASKAMTIAIKKGNPTILKMLIERAFPKAIKADSPSDIMKLLGKGKITLSEAKELMAVLKDKAEIEEIPKLIDKLKQLESKKR